jgi:PAS domain-containing protein
MGDRRARLELSRPAPDLVVARAGFIEGKNDPADVDGMIMLFRRFGDVSFMKQAIAIWTRGDELIAELDAAADELHERIMARETQADELARILARIEHANSALTLLEEAFSSTLGEASRKTQMLLETMLVVAAVVLVFGGAAVSRRMLRKSDSLERALQVSEERFDLAVRGSNAGIFDWTAEGGEMYYSPRFKELLGYTSDEFPNRLEAFVEHLHPDDRAAHAAAINAHL